MPKIQVHIEFDSLEEASAFFSGKSQASLPKASKGHSDHSAEGMAPNPSSGAAPAPAPQPVAAPTVAPAFVMAPAPIPTPAPLASVSTAAPMPSTLTVAAATTASPSDPVEQARAAMNAMVARIPNGQGAAKAKEILTHHGLARIRDAKPEQAAALINAFNTAA